MEPVSGRPVAGGRSLGETRQRELGQARRSGGGAQVGENALPMLFAVAAGVHREVDVLRTESRPPMGRCARPSEAELTSHGEGIRGLHRVGEENLELVPTKRRIEAGMSGEESRDGAPADEHVQHGRAGDFRRDTGDDVGEQTPEKAVPPACIVETKQQDGVEGLA